MMFAFTLIAVFIAFGVFYHTRKKQLDRKAERRRLKQIKLEELVRGLNKNNS